jgi:hypothetical protein
MDNLFGSQANITGGKYRLLELSLMGLEVLY